MLVQQARGRELRERDRAFGVDCSMGLDYIRCNYLPTYLPTYEECTYVDSYNLQ